MHSTVTVNCGKRHVKKMITGDMVSHANYKTKSINNNYYNIIICIIINIVNYNNYNLLKELINKRIN